MRYLFVCLFLTGCICNDYSNEVIKSGEMIVGYNKTYIQNDSTLTPEDKAMMIKACDEYILLLKGQ